MPFTQLLFVSSNKNKMNYTPSYAPRMGQMSSSSVLYPSNNNEFKKNFGSTLTIPTFDPYQGRTSVNKDKPEENKMATFPKALASHSMIDMNSTSARRSFIGKLDSMARNVTPNFQDDSLQERKEFEKPQFPVDGNPMQSMMAPSSAAGSKFTNISGLKGMQQSFESGAVIKKRRESIDLTSGIQRRFSGDNIPFARRTTVTE
jgi:hypothetical protein